MTTTDSALPIIALFIPHGGCPEHCRFCEQSVSGGMPSSASKIREQILQQLTSIPTTQAVEVAFYGGTFTALSQRVQKSYLDVVKEFFPRVLQVRLATRADAIDDDWIKTLKEEYRVSTIEIGVQSFSQGVLHHIGRSTTNEQAVKASKTLQNHQMTMGMHLMYGCPGEGPWEEELERLRSGLLLTNPHFVRIHPLLVLEGTAISQDYRDGKFQPLDLEEAIKRGAQLSDLIESMGVRLARIGLQPNEVMLKGGVIAGPFHPSFGELVRSRRYRNYVENKINEADLGKSEHELEIEIAEAEQSALRGISNQNLNWLKSKFPLLHCKVTVVRRPRSKHRLYENIKIRFRDIFRASQCGQVEFAE